MNVICSWHIANNFIKKSFEEKIFITPLKLNCLIYLLYSNYLYNTGEKLFNEQFMKVDNKPFLVNIEYKFGCWKNNIIREYATNSIGNAIFIKGENFDSNLVYIWNSYKYMSDEELLIFLNENSSFKRTSNNGIISDIEILDDEIKRNESLLEKAKSYRKALSKDYS